MKPAVGDVVHYYEYLDVVTPFAAMIVAVNSDGTVNLKVHHPWTSSEDTTITNIRQSDKPCGGRWCWPTRGDAK